MKLPPHQYVSWPEGSAVSSSTLPETSKLAPEAPQVPTSEATTDTPPGFPAQRDSCKRLKRPLRRLRPKKKQKSKHENGASQAELTQKSCDHGSNSQPRNRNKIQKTPQYYKEQVMRWLKGTEKLNGKSRDARFKARNAIEQRKIRKVSEKLDRFNEKAISAKFPLPVVNLLQSTS